MALKRSSTPMRRGRLNARSKTNSRPPRAQVVIHPEVRARARARSGGLCVWCLYRAGVTDVRKLTDRQLQDLVDRGVVRASRILHHVLRKEKWRHLAEVEANLVCVCKECHDDHEFTPGLQMPRAALPQESIDLAESEGLSWYIEETYAA